MKVRIAYECEFLYEQPVSLSPHIYRLLPKPDRFLSVLNAAFTTNPGASVQYRRDLFDNEIIRCFYPETSNTLEAHLQLELSIQEKNAFQFLLEPHACEFPFSYNKEELHFLEPFLRSTSLELPFWQPTHGPTVVRLVALNTALFNHIRYERREHGPAYQPEETVKKGAGACRDFAVLLVAALRSYGVAARLASGYLCEFGPQERRAEGSLHAWCEAYLPGAGWVGMDPTNGILCNENHITTATGLTFEDVAPVGGTYFAPNAVPSSLKTTLQIDSVQKTG